MKYTKETKVTDMSSKLVIFGFYKKNWELIMSNNGVLKKKTQKTMISLVLTLI